MADIEEVGLDWRLGVPFEVLWITLNELKRFYDEGERQFSSELSKLEMQFRNISPEDDDQADYLCDLRDQYEGILNLKREFAVIGLFRAFERFLRIFLDLQRHPLFKIPPLEGSHFEDLKRQYKKIGVDLSKPPFEWQQIKLLQEIRNCIAHDEGWVDANRAAKLRSFKYSVKENDWIQLQPDFFPQAHKLIRKTCEIVAEKCKESLSKRPGGPGGLPANGL